MDNVIESKATDNILKTFDDLITELPVFEIEDEINRTESISYVSDSDSTNISDIILPDPRDGMYGDYFNGSLNASENIEINALINEIKKEADKKNANPLILGENYARIKKIVKHGNWEKFIKEYFPKISTGTVSRYIRLYKNCAENQETLTEINKSKGYILCNFEPKEKQEDFIKRGFFVNGYNKLVKKMSASELQMVYKKYKEVKAKEIAEKIKTLHGRFSMEESYQRMHEKRLAIELYDEIVEKVQNMSLLEPGIKTPEKLYQRFSNEIIKQYFPESSHEEIISEINEALTYYRDSEQYKSKNKP